MGFRHVIPEVIYRIFNHENPFRMFGGGQSRAFCYAEDAAELTVSIMESDKSNSEIVHVGNSMEEIKIKDLIFCLFDIAGYHPEIDEVSAPAGADAVSRRCPDTGKMNSIVGGYDFTELEIGLEKTFKWYRDYLASGNGRYE
jgi:nucleoside-diphosphate-sugar epimerase